MNPSSPSPLSAADEKAALWAARLDGSELSAADRAQLDDWLASDPAHRSLLSRYCQFSADLEQPLAALVASGAVTLPSPPRRSPWINRWKLFTATLAMAAAAAVVIAVWVKQPVTQITAFATAQSQRQSLSLADGTRVELNAHTRMDIVLSRTERRVRLTQGEAYFDVHPDASRPFIIETRAGSVRVTGTTFNMRVDGSAALEVAVIEGSVQVQAGAQRPPHAPPVLLAAGQSLLSNPRGVSIKTLSAAALADVIAWRHGQIVFEGVPLREALATFGRYHGRAMTATDAAAALPLGGRYSLDDPKGFFAALAELFPIRVSSEVDGTVRVSLKDEP